MWLMLVKDFDKIFVLAFQKSFQKIELKCDKENMLILNACSFQKKMLSNLTRGLIYSLIEVCREDESENFVKLPEIYP